MIKEHYNNKWLKKLNIRAITFNNHIFYSISKYEIPSWLRKHEETHVNQYKVYGIFMFLLYYVYDYLKNRLKGMKHIDAYYYNKFEIEARKGEYK